MVKEIITLQFGNYANYVGTHYWNLRTHERNAQNLKEQQTSENQDSLFFREGRDASNRTIYTPRLLIFDLKENIGSFDGSDAYTEQYTSKNERNDKPSDWEGELEIYDQARDTPSTFLNEQRDRRFKGKQARAGGYKGDSIKTWADFNTTTLHSKTLHSVSGVDCGSSLGEMNTFNEGTEVYDGREKANSVFENDFRLLLEGCDDIQGIQIFSETFGGFAGYCTQFLQEIRNELQKESILLYSVSDRPIKAFTESQLCETGIMLSECLELNTAVMPLNIPTLSERIRNSLSSSAISNYLVSKLNTPNSRFYSSSLHSIVADNFSFPLELNKNTSLGGLLTDATLFGRTPVFSGFLGIDSRQNLDIQFQNNTHTGGGYDDPRISSSRKRTNAAINSNHEIGDQPLPLIDFSGTSKDSTFGLDWDNVKPVKYGTENSKNDTLSNGFSVCRGLSLPSMTSTGGTVFSSSSSFEIPLGFPSDYSDYSTEFGTVSSYLSTKDTGRFISDISRELSQNQPFKRIYLQDTVENWCEILDATKQNYNPE